MSDKHHGQHDESCFGCKLQTIQVSPAATPTRTGSYRHPARTPNPSWERGIPTDSRGMPFLRPGGVDPIGQKEFSEKRRVIEEARKRHQQAPLPSTT